MLIFLSGEAAFALDTGDAATRYSRTIWKQKDGLPQDTIKKILQTADGYLWLGTEEGLARFDGYDFTVFNKDNGDLPSNSVTALAAGSDGSLWVGTADSPLPRKPILDNARSNAFCVRVPPSTWANSQWSGVNRPPP